MALIYAVHPALAHSDDSILGPAFGGQDLAVNTLSVPITGPAVLVLNAEEAQRIGLTQSASVDPSKARLVLAAGERRTLSIGSGTWYLKWMAYAAVATPALGPTTASFNRAAEPGTLIAAITNVPPMTVPTFTPNDGRVVVAGNETDGWKLVTGLMRSAAGAIAGTIAAAGATSAAITITVNAETALSISGTPATTGQVGQYYEFRPTVTGGVGAKRFRLDVSSLPAGLEFDSATGTIRGYPRYAGPCPGNVLSVIDEVGTVASLAAFLISFAGTGGTPTPTPTPGWVTNPVNITLREDADSRTVPKGNLGATGINRRNNVASNVAAAMAGHVWNDDPVSAAAGGTTWRNHLDGSGGAASLGTLSSRFDADPAALWRIPLGINDCVQAGATLSGILSDIREGCALAFAKQKLLILGFAGGNTTGSSALTSDQQLLAFQVNQAIKNQIVNEYPNVFFSNVFDACQQTPGAAGEMKAGVSYDGRHFLALYGFLTGPVERDVILSVLKNPNTPVFNLLSGTQMLPNPTYAGGSGATLPTGCTHTVPSGLNAPTYTSSTVGGVDQCRVQISGTPAANGFYALDQAIAAASIVAGVTPQWGMDITIAQGSTGFCDVTNNFNLNDGTTNANYQDMGTNGAVPVAGQNSVMDGWVASAPLNLNLLTAKTPALLAGASYTTRRARVIATLIGGLPVNLDFTIKRTRLG